MMTPEQPASEASASSRAVSTLLCVALAAGLLPPVAAASAEPGLKLEQVELAAVDGGRAPFLSTASKANVFVFFRTDQERSASALKQIAACQKALAGKSVRWVGLVSGSEALPEVKRAVAASGAQLPVLLDDGDKLYEKLQIRMHPAVGIADAKGVLQAIEPFRELDFADVLQARIRFHLGEIDQAALDRALNPEASPLPEGDPVKRAMRDVKMARTLLELGQLEAAAKRAQKALEQAPVAAAFPVLGMAYARLGRCADARKALDQAQKVAPESEDIAQARSLCAGK